MPLDDSQLDEVTKLLIEGRERIEQGWCQYATRKDGAVCMVGAIYTTVDNTYCDAVRRLQRVIDMVDIVVWNDAPGRTQDEVLDAFDKAIAGE